MMQALLASPWTTWGIAGAATAGVIIPTFIPRRRRPVGG
jgi:hypothetical protein